MLLIVPGDRDYSRTDESVRSKLYSTVTVAPYAAGSVAHRSPLSRPAFSRSIAAQYHRKVLRPRFSAPTMNGFIDGLREGMGVQKCR